MLLRYFLKKIPFLRSSSMSGRQAVEPSSEGSGGECRREDCFAELLPVTIFALLRPDFGPHGVHGRRGEI